MSSEKFMLTWEQPLGLGTGYIILSPIRPDRFSMTMSSLRNGDIHLLMSRIDLQKVLVNLKNPQKNNAVLKLHTVDADAVVFEIGWLTELNQDLLEVIAVSETDEGCRLLLPQSVTQDFVDGMARLIGC